MTFFSSKTVDETSSLSKYLGTLILCVFLSSCAIDSPSKPEVRDSQIPSTHSVNINTAGIEELKLLEGIGQKTAIKIVEYRRVFGPFEVPQQIMLVEGIGEKQFFKIRKHIRTK
jgi:competence protein ComEA